MSDRWITVDGNDACASVAYRLSEVIAIYPITPSSGMAEASDAWAAAGRPNLWGVAPTVVEIFVGAEDAVDSLAKLLAREKPGRGIVKLKVADGAAEIEVQLPGRWAITTETRQAIKAIPGVAHVEMV